MYYYWVQYKFHGIVSQNDSTSSVYVDMETYLWSDCFEYLLSSHWISFLFLRILSLEKHLSCTITTLSKVSTNLSWKNWLLLILLRQFSICLFWLGQKCMSWIFSSNFYCSRVRSMKAWTLFRMRLLSLFLIARLTFFQLLSWYMEQ